MTVYFDSFGEKRWKCLNHLELCTDPHCCCTSHWSLEGTCVGPFVPESCKGIKSWHWKESVSLRLVLSQQGLGGCAALSCEGRWLLHIVLRSQAGKMCLQGAVHAGSEGAGERLWEHWANSFRAVDFEWVFVLSGWCGFSVKSHLISA